MTSRNKSYKTRCAELEAILRMVDEALGLVPITQIRQGYQWMPSEVCIERLALAKDRVYEWRQTNG